MKLSLQKVKKLATMLIIVFAGLLLTNVTQAQEKFILSTTEFTIKNGQDRQFEEGIKAWKTCYLENKGEWTWQIWKRNNGKGSVYVLSSRMENWAELDEQNDEAGKKCWEIAMEKIVPYVESREHNYSHSIPELSRTTAAEMGVIWVTFFKVDNGTIFRETINEISDIMVKVEGDKRGYWYSASGGGTDSPDYFVTTPFKNYAALDIERDGVWKMMENSKGKEDTDKMRADFRSAVTDMWGYMYKRMDELSNFSAE